LYPDQAIEEIPYEGKRRAGQNKTENPRDHELTMLEHQCTPFTLPAGGHIRIDASSTITLATNVVVTAQCRGTAVTDVNMDGLTTIADLQDPFHASVTPQAYATGAATVLAWMLVIMLLITPRTFFAGGAGGTSGLMGRRGLISGATGGASVIGVGSRPWLQKVAALTVAVSLTIATADTFQVASEQYYSGVMDAMKLRQHVVGSMEIKITRIVSDIFLWLAQVQTLIRLFPRHREKVLIKWIGFALIVLDVTFSCLNTFKGNPVGRPKRFIDAIPALSYLFQLALSMLYAAWVCYYAITKHRYAFYHPLMWNMSLVALLSFVAILTPVAFFITDISNSSVAGWGDYFRWVGAAAASVIVWEWVERIEALEREEKKDGILGREIFDGDDMLNFTPTEQAGGEHRVTTRTWHKKGGDGGGGAGGVQATGVFAHGMSGMTDRFNRARKHWPNLKPDTILSPASSQQPLNQQSRPATQAEEEKRFSARTSAPQAPLPAVTPASRSDTTSADSTVYTVRYHPISEPSPRPIQRRRESSPQRRPSRSRSRRIPPTTAEIQNHDPEKALPHSTSDSQATPQHHRWEAMNPFKRRKALPPAEVRNASIIAATITQETQQAQADNQPIHDYAKWDVKGRLGAFAAEQGEKYREKSSRKHEVVDLPVTVIPAQPRGRTWSPEILHTSDQSEVGNASPAAAEQQNQSPNTSSRHDATQPSSPSPEVWRSISQRNTKRQHRHYSPSTPTHDNNSYNHDPHAVPPPSTARSNRFSTPFSADSAAWSPASSAISPSAPVDPRRPRQIDSEIRRATPGSVGVLGPTPVSSPSVDMDVPEGATRVGRLEPGVAAAGAGAGAAGGGVGVPRIRVLGSTPSTTPPPPLQGSASGFIPHR